MRTVSVAACSSGSESARRPRLCVLLPQRVQEGDGLVRAVFCFLVLVLVSCFLSPFCLSIGAHSVLSAIGVKLRRHRKRRTTDGTDGARTPAVHAEANFVVAVEGASPRPRDPPHTPLGRAGSGAWRRRVALCRGEEFRVLVLCYVSIFGLGLGSGRVSPHAPRVLRRRRGGGSARLRCRRCTGSHEHQQGASARERQHCGRSSANKNTSMRLTDTHDWIMYAKASPSSPSAQRTPRPKI
ncbi:hypothetical protein DFH08DRAFT_837724 [Mycena albidolilacea]|uniref:Uncharacterized protein n=1 Tax=Mycena albidolilacea TaxID=1033008 RepID=A0AAD7ANC5_9AGAR|nr:hypothetical protein DFH08DRAFT_837724 [Mycena albidolilacea]